jgi:NTP pyrophosphatase (non-canonical NTP hydrolase)
MTNIDIIREHLDQPELLTQLAEEAAELCKAALKLRRVYTGVNPTPVSGKEAFTNLLEELADVYVCIHALGFDTCEHLNLVQRTANAKMERWAGRLDAAHR